MNYPKVLVIANNSFSLTNSNGRTLGGFFIGWPKERLAQFCIGTDRPNYEVCENYYCLTDRSILDACIYFRKPRREKLDSDTSINQSKNIRRVKRTAFHILIRNLIWMSRKWDNEEFNQWVRDFSPDVVLLQSGDSIFMLDIALRISKKRHVPLMVFNTEGYYFFKQNYFHKGMCNFMFFPLYQAWYKRKYRSLMKHVKFSIYGNDLLKRDYDKEFGGNSIVLYTSSTLSIENIPFNQENPRFSYLGNLTFDRPAALMEVGEVLQSINRRYHLDVYGKATPEVERILRVSKGIQYHGFVQHQDVAQVIKTSDVLFHVEGAEDRKDCLRYGFSTKIADSLASGKSFVLYSFPDIACANYIKETGAGWFASNKDELKKVLETIITDKSERVRKLKKAQDIVVKNHSMEKNRILFFNCISQVLVHKLG